MKQILVFLLLISATYPVLAVPRDAGNAKRNAVAGDPGSVSRNADSPRDGTSGV
jgi:hypothetical protein